MKEKFLNLDDFARRVDALSDKKEVSLERRYGKFKGIHLPTVDFSIGKKRGGQVHLPVMKNPKSVRVSLHESDKKAPLMRSAYETYKCCQNQDLHLFQLQKIYLEKKFLLKGVVGWKLPKRKIVQQQLKAFVEGIKFHPDSYKTHLITWIAKAKKSAEEKSIQDNLELQKQRKETRNYPTNRPLFQ